MKTEPILSVGTFGTHIPLNPGGSYSFFGSVPADLRRVSLPTFEEMLARFFAWLDSLSDNERRDHAINLRADIFAQYMHRDLEPCAGCGQIRLVIPLIH